jgi:hypothetical protein
MGTVVPAAVAQWLRCCATNRKVAGSIPAGVGGFFIDIILPAMNLEAIIKGENTVRFIKCQRIRWLGHIERMQDTAIPKKMMYGKLYATRRRG